MYSRLRAARGKTAMGGTPNCLDYCEIFIAYTQFTNVVAGRGVETLVLKCSRAHTLPCFLMYSTYHPYANFAHADVICSIGSPNY